MILERMILACFVFGFAALLNLPASAQTNRATFPKNFEQYVLYATYDRGSSKEEAFASPETLKIATFSRCQSCHQSQANNDFMFTIDRMRAYLP